MTTNLERSNWMWRSSSGSAPLPIEPKPIITMGPSKRAWIGKSVIDCLQSIHVRRRGQRSRQRRESRVAPTFKVALCRLWHDLRSLFVHRRDRRSRHADETARAVERAGRELVTQQTTLLVETGQPEPCGFCRRETEAAVIG